MELIFKIGFTAFLTAVWCLGLYWVWTSHIDLKTTFNRMLEKTVSPPSWVATREANKIYQEGKAVGEVTGAVTQDGDKITFAQIANTSGFNHGQPFEYQHFRVKVLTIQTLTGSSVAMTSQGVKNLSGVYEGVVCQILQ